MLSIYSMVHIIWAIWDILYGTNSLEMLYHMLYLITSSLLMTTDMSFKCQKVLRTIFQDESLMMRQRSNYSNNNSNNNEETQAGSRGKLDKPENSTSI